MFTGIRGVLLNVAVTSFMLTLQPVANGFRVDPKLGSSKTNTITIREPTVRNTQTTYALRRFLAENAHNSIEIEDMRTRRHLAEHTN